MTTSNPGRIDALLAKRAALDARISRLKQRNTAAERRARSRALLLLGNALEQSLKQQPNAMHAVRQLISQRLKPRDQKLVLDYLLSQQEPALDRDPAGA